jgi:fructose-1,6-bisphosphatase/sedoheptulose 1,7-bisphosphatase-like protein
MITTRALRLLRQKRHTEALEHLRDAGGYQAAVNLLLTGQVEAALTVLQGQAARDVATQPGAAPLEAAP